jgi:DNA-binding transcriptional ArsR family regulator
MHSTPLNNPINAPKTSTLSADRLLSLLGGRLRLAILRHLSEGPSHVGGIAKSVHASIGLVSHNLRQLRDAGLVTRQINARERIYDLAPDAATRLTTGTLIRLASVEGARIDVRLPLRNPAVIQTSQVATHRLLNAPTPIAKAI